MSGLTTEVAFLSRALKMPRIRRVAPDMAKTARAEGWDPLGLLIKVLAEEVAARETHGGENRIRAARFPQVKTLYDFDFATNDPYPVPRSRISTSSTSSAKPTT